jgi:hypothetical protein
MKKLNKNLYYCDCSNFGDELNKILFEKVFSVKFTYCPSTWEADYIGIGSVLGWSCVKPDRLNEKMKYPIRLFLGKKTKLTVLGAGFIKKPKEGLKFARKMDFRIVRGKLTEEYLWRNHLLKETIVLGDLGLLASYLYNGNVEKKYSLGIIPHFTDLNSPIIYDIYKKYCPDCIVINVQDAPELVIEQIVSCKNTISTSLHGLIVSDSFGIPNLWIENKWKEGKLDHFKYLDYYR